MKKLLLILLVFCASCTRDLTPLIEVELPSMTFSTPAVSAGTFPLIREISVEEIDRLRNGGTVSINSLAFAAIAPETLNLSGFTSARFVVSANGTSVTVYNAAVSVAGRSFTATTSADITPVLVAAKAGNGKVQFAMSVTTNTATPAATWRISTVAAISPL